MKQNRSSFTFNIKNPEQAQAAINEWLNTCGFQFVSKDGEDFYRRGEPMLEGYGYFKSQIIGDQVTVWFWQRSLTGERAVYEQFTLDLSNYRAMTDNLLSQLANLADAAPQNPIAQSAASNSTPTPANPPSTVAQNPAPVAQKIVTPAPQPNPAISAQMDAYNSRLAKIALGLAVLGVILAFSGATYGLLVYILIFCLAARGLKSSQKNLATAAIFLGIASIAITIIQVLKALGDM